MLQYSCTYVQAYDCHDFRPMLLQYFYACLQWREWRSASIIVALIIQYECKSTLQFTKQYFPFLYALNHVCTFLLLFGITSDGWFWSVSRLLGGNWFWFSSLALNCATLPHCIPFSFLCGAVMNGQSDFTYHVFWQLMLTWLFSNVASQCSFLLEHPMWTHVTYTHIGKYTPF